MGFYIDAMVIRLVKHDCASLIAFHSTAIAHP